MKKYILLMLISSSNVFADANTTCLAQTIYHEARGTSVKSRQAVGLVVLNRKYKKNKSICSIVKERGQFDYIKNKLKIDKTSKEWKDILSFTKSFLLDVPVDFTYGSTLFHNVNVRPNWNKSKIKKTIKLDNHIFYRELV